MNPFKGYLLCYILPSLCRLDTQICLNMLIFLTVCFHITDVSVSLLGKAKEGMGSEEGAEVPKLHLRLGCSYEISFFISLMRLPLFYFYFWGGVHLGLPLVPNSVLHV